MASIAQSNNLLRFLLYASEHNGPGRSRFRQCQGELAATGSDFIAIASGTTLPAIADRVNRLGQSFQPETSGLGARLTTPAILVCERQTPVDMDRAAPGDALHGKLCPVSVRVDTVTQLNTDSAHRRSLTVWTDGLGMPSRPVDSDNLRSPVERGAVVPRNLNISKSVLVCMLAVPAIAQVSTGWKMPFNGSTSEPAIHEGTLYIGSMDLRFYALNKEDGRVVWSTTGKLEVSYPSVSGNVAYFARRASARNRSYSDAEFSFVDAVEISTRKTLWTHVGQGGADPRCVRQRRVEMNLSDMTGRARARCD